jgi:hypothetical protein
MGGGSRLFGRVRRAAARAAAQEQLRGYAVVHAYNPQALAGALAVGMGAGSIMSGPAVASTDNGLVSAVGEAVSRTLAWGEEAQRHYVRLPHRVLVVLTAQRVIVQEWNLFGQGRTVASWPLGSFSGEPVRFTGEIGVEITLASGLKALLTNRSGPTHRRAKQLIAVLTGSDADKRTVPPK